MQKGLIGVQMMMLKEQVARDGIYRVLQKLAEMGFHAVEVSQIPMTRENVRQLKQASDDFNITICAMSCGVEDLSPDAKYPGDTLQNDFDKIVDDCKTVGCNILRIGMLPMYCAESPQAILALTKRCEEYALRLKEQGIDLYYHTHHMEFFRWQGKTLLEHMLENTAALGFELDSHWMWRGGVDPVNYIPKFAGRIRALHLKDYRIGAVDMASYPVPGPEKIDYMFTHLVEYAEVGEGALDFPAIIQAGLASGSEFFLIEQDRQYGRDVYECLAISRDNLVKMGYEDWF